MNRPVRTRTPGGVGGASEQSGSLSRSLFGLFRGKDSQISIAEPCVLQQLSQRSSFQISVAVDWYGQNRRISRLRINMMTAMDALQKPTVSFQHFAQMPPGDNLHNSISAS